MKIEKLDNNKSKIYFLIGVIITLLFVIIVNFITSKANYRKTESIPLAKGTINYSLADLNIIAMYKEKDEYTDETDKYEVTEQIPNGNYVLSDKSYCEINKEKDQSIKIEYKDNLINILGLTKKGTKCYIYFDKALCKPGNTACETILANSDYNPDVVPDFSKTSCESGCEESTNGLFKGEENGQPTYYFRGTVSNNWVKFAGYYWRIIRINGDGSIRMIYSGIKKDATGGGALLNNGASQVINTNAGDNAYVGYMYGSTGQEQNETGYTATHTNTSDSEIKTYVDNWYTNNLKNVKENGKSASEYIDTEAGFCGDRTPYDQTYSTEPSNKEKYGVGRTRTSYGSYQRRVHHKPEFDCPNANNDLYTLSGAKTGNKALTNPIGLITADEVIFAGGQQSKGNKGYWLYIGTRSYWTMSPGYFNGSTAYVYEVRSAGFSYDGDITEMNVNNTGPGVRPVINLRADVKISGHGLSNDPYVIETE